MISKSSIETVFETARIEEVIGDFVNLKRAGSNLKGLSPFSDERSPSFMVSPVKQIWKDFSSGKGGNAVTFLMEHEHFTYPEAIRYLAKKYNIELEETVQSDDDKMKFDAKESMYLVSEFAKKYFQNTLLNLEEGKAIGLTYFKERGFTLETIKKFNLGYSPETWDAFTKEALGQGYKLDFLISTGLSIPKDDRPFDRFKGRVMFPIESMSGRTLGFGGRILTNDKKAAKYLNSPESEIYHKSKVLYGIFQAKQAISKQNNCYLVEGYTDVIQFHQSGIENVVASSGTALTPDQIRLINRLTKNITVLFDGDAAGLRASIRGIDLILEEGMNVKVCTFPDGEDPDSFAKKNTYDVLTSYLEKNAKDFIQFKASLLMDEAQNDPIKKADLIRDMVVSISKIPDRIQREIYIQECSRIMDISEQVLQNTLAQMFQKNLSDDQKKQIKNTKTFEVQKATPVVQESKVDLLHQLEKSIIGILLLYGNEKIEYDNVFLKIDETGKEKWIVEKIENKIFEIIYMNLQEDEVAFSNDIFRGIYEDLVGIYLRNEQLDSKNYIHTVQPAYSQVLTDLLMDDEKYQLHGWFDKKQVVVKDKHNEEVLQRLVTDTIIAYREHLITQVNTELIQEVLNPKIIDKTEILSMINEYNKLKVTITRRIGRMRTSN
ncbi:DNA primase [Flavobacterium branchiophilum]|uniref:DNA primase n=1 Tax=Flavobacterium branchiophilum TaxID=55197 RepID=A0A543G5W3_9FLAO|nr:DNA primase [Flavobacterium branchiophilum]OXA80670.1 DNA primase [Flavobacterium branchiophilum] [Flavobacterium branchiophilum NBRC 15030 = ATCC 35035]TQM41468.1 DNA primase [Flavobacterium branchiophilum]GEM54169.1 DNA primase [Flavobacterium branchiophilum NBRC 15030 = ATCC 35035]